jgi:hypothetical protein
MLSRAFRTARKHSQRGVMMLAAQSDTFVGSNAVVTEA